MAQPRKVRQAAAEAERIHNEVYGKDGKGGKPPETPPAVATPPVEGTPKVEELPPELRVVETPPAAETPPVQQTVETPPAGGETPPATPPGTPPKEETVDYWKQRALTKEGVDRKIVEENQQLRQDMSELRGAMSTLTAMQGQATPPQTPPEQVPAQAQARHLLKPEEIADYGEDLIDVMKRAAREAVGAEIDGLKRENKSLKASLTQFREDTGKRARDDVYGTLQDKVPNWQEINSDPQFLAWLDGQDMFSGQARGLLLNSAFEANDAPRVTAFFESYLREQQTVSPDQTPPAAQPPETPPAQPQQTLDTMVAPGKPRGGTAQAQGDQKRTWSQPQIHAFYQDVHKGKYRGREKDQRLIEQDIIAATKEDRIVY